MKITRRFTTAGQDVYSAVKWERRSSKITGADGATVFEMKDAEAPASWSQLATDIVVSKYFRKAGVPRAASATEGEASGAGDQSSGEEASATGPETSVRQVVHRLVACWRQWGEKHGYFDGPEDAEAFYDELVHMLLHQMAAPNSPQWFNTGLETAYGISGPPQGHWVADPATGRPRLAEDAYTHPQPHACFIQPVRDDLVNEGGIMDLWVREARLFKYGSGTGTNFSTLRGENEPLSGGGRSSGLMSFLRIGDRAASAIKSGGTTRRAAKMVCLDVDHPDIVEFVRWKVREELKVAAMVEGMKHLPAEQRAVAQRMGLKLDYDFNGEAYATVSGQNSNNSVRLSNEFLEAVETDGTWRLIRRTDGGVAREMPARELWEEICFAAWRCADPGVQFDTTINEWHTCPRSGRINASNPCSEYMFLDNTACNLASLNLLKFYDARTRRFDVEAYEHAIRLWTIVLEISVLMAAFPSREIAELSWRYRTLGLGYANLGALLMQAGIPYDSEEGRGLCAALTAILTGRAYAASAEMARELGPFAGFESNREDMLRVIRNHRRAALGVPRESDEWEGLSIRPLTIDHSLFDADASADRRRVPLANAADVLQRAVAAWDDALQLGERHGYRNAQVTVIAPTGTIGLLMDCDTTGVEPDFALTKFKKLAGGGHFKIANQSLQPALRALGYTQAQIDDIHRYVMGALSVDVPMPDASGAFPADSAAATTLRSFLESKGYEGEEIVALENELPKVFELGFAFSAWSMPERVLRRHGVDPEAARIQPGFNGLRLLGLTAQQIEALNRLVCGTQTVEGAPHLKPEHLPVFDCANRCGTIGVRYIAPEGHIRMMAAAQPFISGAISKTINLPNEASVEDISAAYRLSWTLGLKANALYRDGCKLSQPLSTRTDKAAETDDKEAGGEPVERAVGDLAGESCDEVAATAAATSSSTSFSEPAPATASGPDAALAARASTPAPAPARPAPADGRRDEAASTEVIERVVFRPTRRRLPDTRRSITHRFNVAGHEGYLTVGLYDDGSPGELFITMAKEGSTIGGLMDCLGTATSVSLQYGVPLASLVNKFAHQRFEPMGLTTNRDIPMAKSLVDYIFRWLGMQFIPGYRQENAPRREPAPIDSDATGSVRTAVKPNVKEDAAWHDQQADRHRLGEASGQNSSGRATHAGGNGNGHPPIADSQNGARAAGHAALNGTLRGAPLGQQSPGAAPKAISTPAAPSSRRDGEARTGASPTPGPALGSVGAAAPQARTTMLVARETRERIVVEEDESAGPAEGMRRVVLEHSAASVAHAQLMGDAPACASCGHITVRSGACYKCTNCGAQNGCG